MTARTYLITGAASGIGAATARLLSRQQANLVLNTRGNEAGLTAVAKEARDNGATVVNHLGDVGNSADIAGLVELAAAQFGRIDGIAAVAGFADATPLADLTTENLQRSFTAIDQAFVDLVQQSLPLLRKSETGRVVAVSSFVAHVFRLDGKFLPASAMAKAGLEALVKSFAAELAAENINVNCVVPGFIEKDPGTHRAISAGGFEEARARIPKKRLGRPEDVAMAIEFLLAEKADYLTGQCLHVDGGLSL